MKGETASTDRGGSKTARMVWEVALSENTFFTHCDLGELYIRVNVCLVDVSRAEETEHFIVPTVRVFSSLRGNFTVSI